MPLIDDDKKDMDTSADIKTEIDISITDIKTEIDISTDIKKEIDISTDIDINTDIKQEVDTNTDIKKEIGISTDMITMQTDNLQITDPSIIDLTLVEDTDDEMQKSANLTITDPSVIDLTLDEESDENTEKSTAVGKGAVKRIPKKSSATPQKQTGAIRRKQVASPNIKKERSFHDKFMENFDPERSARERRKLSRKVNAVPRKASGAVYDKNGIHIATGIDLCDCLIEACPGCHFPCEKCESPKCGPECRCNRKFAYEQYDFEGCDLVIKNPLKK